MAGRPRRPLGGVVALVPVKDLREAKGRLAGRLAPRERARLVLACLDHVLTALREAGSIDHVAVVSRSESVLRRATGAGAWGIDERTLGGVDGQNRALEAARTALLRGDVFGVGQTADATADRGPALLVVSADLPLLRARDVDALVVLGNDERSVVVAPDREGEGTNALLVRPGDAIPFRFGPDSRRRHQSEAERAGCAIRFYRGLGTALDLDEPADLDRIDLGRLGLDRFEPDEFDLDQPHPGGGRRAAEMDRGLR